MFSKIKAIENRYEDLERKLSDPEIVGNRSEYRRIAKEHSDLGDIVETFRKCGKVAHQLEEDQRLLQENDEELKELLRKRFGNLRQVSKSSKIN